MNQHPEPTVRSFLTGEPLPPKEPKPRPTGYIGLPIKGTKDRSLPGKARRKMRKLARRTVKMIAEMQEVKVYSEGDLRGMTRPELNSVAKDFGLPGYSKMKVDVLRQKLADDPGNVQLVADFFTYR